MISPLMLRGLWAYRGFVLGSVKREFQSKYVNAMLGAVWSVLSPLAMILVYTVIFAEVMRAKLPGSDSTFAYSIYLCAGILTWGLFAEIVARGQNMFLEQANLIKKISFPRICLPIIVVTNALVNCIATSGIVRMAAVTAATSRRDLPRGGVARCLPVSVLMKFSEKIEARMSIL